MFIVVSIGSLFLTEDKKTAWEGRSFYAHIHHGNILGVLAKFNMANKRSIEAYSDTGFVSGFGRYFIATQLMGCGSWDEILNELDKEPFVKMKDQLLNELRLHNGIMVIEHTLISFIERNTDERKADSLKRYLLDCLKRYRDLDSLKEAELVLTKESGEDDLNISPHILLYVCGLSLGNLTHIVRDFCINVEHKQKILEDLNRLNESRTILVHGISSGRVEAEKKIALGVEDVARLENYLEADRKESVFG